MPLKELIENLQEIVTTDSAQQNRIMMSYNPILTISLSCIHLASIGKSIAVFSHEANSLIEELLTFGEVIIGEMDGEVIGPIFMDTDFKDRTVLHLITYNGFAQLMSDNKVAALLDELWVGKMSYECDGRNDNFSQLTFLATTPIRKLPEVPIVFSQLTGSSFKPEIKEDFFQVQYKFRRKSIATLFQKNFASALIQVSIYQYINYLYLVLFNKQMLQKIVKTENAKVPMCGLPGYDACPGDAAMLTVLEANFNVFKRWSSIGILISIASLLSVICQFAFNVFSEQNVPFDKWSKLDLLNSITNVFVLQFFNILESKDFINDSLRYTIILLNVAMVLVSWIRFIGFFLVINKMSVLLMTLSKMITNCITFLFIDFCYMLMMVPVFGILFQEENINYISPMQTLLTLWDVMITGGGVFFDSTNPYAKENDWLTIFHLTMGNIFMLNYLIAILATIYEVMLEKGDFAYKSNKYMYIERFYIPMQDMWGYTELVVHPPPMNYISGLLLFAVFSPGGMKRTSEVISKVIFWIENLYYVAVMFVNELILAPYIFFRQTVNTLKVAKLTNALVLIPQWLVCAPFYLTYCVMNDMYFYCKILCDYREDDDESAIKGAGDAQQDAIVIYNEVLDTLRAILNIHKYHRKKKLKPSTAQIEKMKAVNKKQKAAGVE